MHERASLRPVVGSALAAATFLAAISWSLGPIGALGHLRGMATTACLMLPHLVSDVAALALVALVGSAIVAAVSTIVASIVLDRRLQSTTRRSASLEDRRRVRAVAAEAGVGSRLVVFACAEPLAWSRGVLRPAIWISSGGLDVLDDDELRAVLAHEQHHCDRRDPARLLCATLLARSFHAFPLVADAARRMCRAMEFAADDRACDVAGPRATARALLRFTESRTPAFVPQVSGGASVVERVQRLVGPHVADIPSSRGARVWTAVAACTAIACVLVVAQLPRM